MCFVILISPGPRCIKLLPDFLIAKIRELFWTQLETLYFISPKFFCGQKKSLAKSFMQWGPDE